MKNLKTIITCTFLFILCSVSAQKGLKDWREMNDFHEVLSFTYHSMEKGNFEPIKNSSGKLLEKAQALSEKNMPKEFINPKTTEVLKNIKKEAAIVDKMVKNEAPDEEVKKQMDKLHDSFHKIIEFCEKQK